MKSSIRAIRRAHKERMKAKCRRINPHDIHAKAADNLAKCSCYSCGNPRKFFKQKRLAEVLAELDQQEQLDHLFLINATLGDLDADKEKPDTEV